MSALLIFQYFLALVATVVFFLVAAGKAIALGTLLSGGVAVFAAALCITTGVLGYLAFKSCIFQVSGPTSAYDPIFLVRTRNELYVI